MKLGYQRPALLINAPPPVTSDVSLIDKRDGSAVQRRADPFRIKRSFERCIRNGRNDNAFQYLADTAILHWAGFCPAAIGFLWRLIPLGSLCAQQTRRTDEKKKHDPNGRRSQSRRIGNGLAHEDSKSND